MNTGDLHWLYLTGNLRWAISLVRTTSTGLEAAAADSPAVILWYTVNRMFALQ